MSRFGSVSGPVCTLSSTHVIYTFWLGVAVLMNIKTSVNVCNFATLYGRLMLHLLTF